MRKKNLDRKSPWILVFEQGHHCIAITCPFVLTRLQFAYLDLRRARNCEKAFYLGFTFDLVDRVLNFLNSNLVILSPDSLTGSGRVLFVLFVIHAIAKSRSSGLATYRSAALLSTATAAAKKSAYISRGTLSGGKRTCPKRSSPAKYRPHAPPGESLPAHCSTSVSRPSRPPDGAT